MKVFALASDAHRVAGLRPVREADIDLFIDGFSGETMKDAWPEPEVVPRNPELPLADFASIFGSVIGWSERTVDAFGPDLEGCGEWLALRGLPYFVFNTLALADVLDPDGSEADYFEPGRIMDLRRLSLRAPLSALPTIFKLPEWKKGRSLVTQAFLDRAARSNLSGLQARQMTPA